jgi:thiamine transport system ATP-binding protein
VLEISHLTVTRGDTIVLHDLSFLVRTGEIIAVTGPSGSGKSTLLQAVAGLIRIDAGKITLDSVDLTPLPTHKRNVGMMFQDGQLFPHMTVAENIDFGLRMKKMDKTQRQQRVAELLSLVQLENYQQRPVNALSGGESRRIALARSLAPSPPVLLLDEPLTGLEEDLRYELATELARIIHLAGTTTIVVTHDLREAKILGNSVVALHDIDRRT